VARQPVQDVHICRYFLLSDLPLTRSRYRGGYLPFCSIDGRLAFPCATVATPRTPVPGNVPARSGKARHR
jgi:hypothetical protein